jgi:hypothetical protein
VWDDCCSQEAEEQKQRSRKSPDPMRHTISSYDRLSSSNFSRDMACLALLVCISTISHIGCFFGARKARGTARGSQVTILETQTKISSNSHVRTTREKAGFEKADLVRSRRREDATHGRLRIQMPLCNKRGAILRG